MSRMSEVSKKREGYNPKSNMFWVEDPLTPEEYEFAAKNGISYANAWSRRHRSGWPKERVINEPLGQNQHVKGYKKMRTILTGKTEAEVEMRFKKLGAGWTKVAPIREHPDRWVAGNTKDSFICVVENPNPRPNKGWKK